MWERKQTVAHRSHLIPSALVLLPENPSLIPEAGCGQRPQKAMDTMPYFDAKKYKNMYRILPDGYTIDKMKDSTAGYFKNRQQNLTYLIHIRGFHFP